MRANGVWTHLRVACLLAGGLELTAWGQARPVAFPATPRVAEAPAVGTMPGPAVSPGEPFDLSLFHQNALENRLGVGLRVTSFRLSDTQRPADENRVLTFLGYINELEEEDSVALRPVLTYRLSDYVGLELTWDEVAARTVNFGSGASDGTVRMGGPIVGISAQYCILGYVCPYVGVGYAPWSASFDTERWWALGWGTPEEYRAAGSPPDQQGLHPPRKMEVDDDSAIALSLGVVLRLHRHVDADILVRRMSLTSKARFYRGDPLEFQSDGEFPLDHTTLAFGIHGVF